MFNIFVFGLLFMTVFSSSEAYSRSDTRTSCLARSYLKPSYETYQKQILARFESTPTTIASYKDRGKIQNIITQFYDDYNPRDVFCIIDGDIDVKTLRPALSTDGGTLFVLAPSDVDLELALEATDIIENKSLASALSNGIMKTLWAAPDRACERYIEDPQEPFTVGSPAWKCLERTDKLISALKDKLAVEVASYNAPPSGKIEIIRFPRKAELGSSEDLSDAVSTFLYRILGHELVNEPQFNPASRASYSFLTVGFMNSGGSNNISQWVAGVFEEALSGAVLLTASETLRALSAGRVMTLPKDAKTLKRSIYLDFVSGDLNNDLGSGPINFRSTFLVESGFSDW